MHRSSRRCLSFIDNDNDPSSSTTNLASKKQVPWKCLESRAARVARVCLSTTILERISWRSVSKQAITRLHDITWKKQQPARHIAHQVRRYYSIPSFVLRLSIVIFKTLHFRLYLTRRVNCVAATAHDPRPSLLATAFGRE
jgi:hypothetical protein